VLPVRRPFRRRAASCLLLMSQGRYPCPGLACSMPLPPLNRVSHPEPCSLHLPSCHFLHPVLSCPSIPSITWLYSVYFQRQPLLALNPCWQSTCTSARLQPGLTSNFGNASLSVCLLLYSRILVQKAVPQVTPADAAVATSAAPLPLPFCTPAISQMPPGTLIHSLANTAYFGIYCKRACLPGAVSSEQ
jgi:hypothetical protein